MLLFTRNTRSLCVWFSILSDLLFELRMYYFWWEITMVWIPLELSAKKSHWLSSVTYNFFTLFEDVLYVNFNLTLFLSEMSYTHIYPGMPNPNAIVSVMSRVTSIITPFGKGVEERIVSFITFYSVYSNKAKLFLNPIITYFPSEVTANPVMSSPSIDYVYSLIN